MDDDIVNGGNNEEENNYFDNENIKNEINEIIKEITNSSILEQIDKDKLHTLFKMISIVASMVIKLGALLNSVNDNVHLHSNVLLQLTKIYKYLRKYLYISLGISIVSIVINIMLVIYLLSL